MPSIQRLFQDDIIIATTGVLRGFPRGSEPYEAIKSFFTLAQDILLDHPTSSAKPSQHTLRSTSISTNGATSPQVPAVRPLLREALYTMGPTGPLFTSIASRDTSTLISTKLPSSLTLPTSTGGTFTASSTAIVPANFSNISNRKLADVCREPRTFENRRRAGFSDDKFSKLQATKWLDWGYHASFAPEWDDGGVGGGFSAEWMVVDWAYKHNRRERRKKAAKDEEEEPMQVEQAIDEKLLLEWEESKPPKDLVEGGLVEEDNEMSVGETLQGLSNMITLLGQMQTLRMASGKTDIPDDERALGKPNSIFKLILAENIVSTFHTLITTYSIPPKALISELSADAYNIIALNHPEFVGSLPSKPFPQWNPPQPLPPQRNIYTPQNRILQAQPRTPGTPAYSAGRPQPMTPINRAYSTPGYGTPGQPYTPLGNRPVGRPRKYERR